MNADDILYSPVPDYYGLYQIWFVPQPWHEPIVRSQGEFITVYTPKPVPYAEAAAIVAELTSEGFDTRALEMRRMS
jgi:hypothetical protein